MLAYGLNVLAIPPQNSACCAEEQLHWSLLIWLIYMILHDVMLRAKTKAYGRAREPM